MCEPLRADEVHVDLLGEAGRVHLVGGTELEVARTGDDDLAGPRLLGGRDERVQRGVVGDVEEVGERLSPVAADLVRDRLRLRDPAGTSATGCPRSASAYATASPIRTTRR